MKINSDYFNFKLNILSKVYKAKNAFPALTGLLISNGKAILSNGDSYIITNLEIEDKDFKALIPFKPLKEIFSKIKNDTVTLEVEKNKLKISCKKTNFKLNLLDFDTYPKYISKTEIEEIEETGFLLHTNIIRKINDKVTFACAKSDKKPILKGINFNASNGALKCVATDSFKLAYLKIEDIKEDFNFTIEQNDLKNISDIIPQDYAVRIVFKNNSILTIFGDTIYSCRLLEGIYPNVEKLIKPNYEQISIEINKKDFLDSLEMLNVFTGNEKIEELLEKNIIKLSFYKNELTMSIDNNAFGNGCSVINCKYSEDNEFKIACDYKMLLETIKNNEEDNIVLNVSKDNRPIYNENSKADYVQLILPVKIN